MKSNNIFTVFLAVVGLLSLVIVTVPHAHGQTSIATDGDIVGDGVSLLELKSSYCEHLELLHADTALPVFCVLPQGTRFVFVTSTGSTSGGNLVQWANDLVDPARPFTDGLLAADAICQYRADNATTPLPGTYKAWLSTDEVNAKDRIGDHRWVLTDGTTVVADSLSDLVDCTNPDCLQSAINQDESTAQANTYTFTSTVSQGLGGPHNCNNWTSTLQTDRYYYGQTISTDATWTRPFLGEGECSQPDHLYCFGK